jgi:hypothetical protein
MQLMKSQNSFEKESSMEKERERRSLSRSREEKSRMEEKELRPKEDRPSKDDVNFLMQVGNQLPPLTNYVEL